MQPGPARICYADRVVGNSRRSTCLLISATEASRHFLDRGEAEAGILQTGCKEWPETGGDPELTVQIRQ